MSIETKHFINGIEIRPLNADSIGFKIDFTQDYNQPELNTDAIVLTNEAKDLVLSHIDTYGVFEGIPYTVKFANTTLEYYIDLTENPQIGDSEIEVKIKRRSSVLHFMERARGLSFEAINKTNPIPTIDIKYQIVKENQGINLILFSLTTFTLAKELIEQTKALAVAVADTVAAVTPDPVAVVTPPGVGLVPVKPADIIANVAKLVAQIIYTVAILIQLITLIKKIIEILAPPVKVFKGSKIIDLVTKGCEKIGYTLESNFLNQYSRLSICPVPLLNPNPSVWQKLSALDNTLYTKGYPSALDSTPTLGSLINELIKIFNLDVRAYGNTIRIEPNIIDEPSITIQNTLNIQSKRENSHSYNTGDAWKRYYLNYRYDIADTHTLDNYQKAQTEYSTEPLNVVNSDLVNIRGLVNIDANFAIGVRKDKLNFVETALLGLATFADSVISFFGGSGNNATKVKSRVGVMQISQQQYNVSKLMYINNGRQSANYLDIIGMEAIYNNFHTTNQVKDNFKKIFTSTIRLSDTQFENIANGGNYIKDALTDEDLEILTINWINETREAEINYSVKSDEGNNTQTIKIF